MHCIYFVRFRRKAPVQAELERTKQLLGRRVISILRKLSELGNTLRPAYRKYVEAHEGARAARGKSNTSGKGDLLLSWRRAGQSLDLPARRTALSIYRFQLCLERPRLQQRRKVRASCQEMKWHKKYQTPPLTLFFFFFF